MIRRARWCAWRRVVAACLATWFAVLTADPTAVHACLMHGAPATAPAATLAAGHAAAPAPSHDHASPDAPASPSAPAPSHACTCLGHCCAATPSLAAATPTITLVAALTTPERPTGRPAHEYVATWVDFVLPFATAPPAMTLG